MKIRLCSILLVFISFLCFSQTEVYFKYDEAGNQRYRGPDASGKHASNNSENPIEEVAKMSQTEDYLADNDKGQSSETDFWAEIRIYPVPVKDVLNLDWTDKADGLITQISLYQHNTIHYIFRHQNMPSEDNVININMSGRPAGIYILTFVLKDGQKLSRNIIKN